MFASVLRPRDEKLKKGGSMTMIKGINDQGSALGASPRSSLRYLKRVLTLMLALTLLAGAMPGFAQSMHGSQPKTKRIDPRKSVGRYIYVCDGGAKIVKDLFQHEGTGLHYAILGLPDGNIAALQQAAKSGEITFTDDITYRWTLKGDGASLDIWGINSGWTVRFEHCEYDRTPGVQSAS
jgi:hypothetical protein